MRAAAPLLALYVLLYCTRCGDDPDEGGRCEGGMEGEIGEGWR